MFTHDGGAKRLVRRFSASISMRSSILSLYIEIVKPAFLLTGVLVGAIFWVFYRGVGMWGIDWPAAWGFGARDLAFPKLNLISWYLYILAGAAALYSLLAGGGVDTGWTFYTPLTSAYSKGHVVATIVAIFIAGFSSIANGLNFIVSIHSLRAPGMTWYKMPVFL
jgi:heme/copper-type cytochrome/quinol oxidase subunit 1